MYVTIPFDGREPYRIPRQKHRSAITYSCGCANVARLLFSSHHENDPTGAEMSLG